jgi:indolepyruvate ferredoxin oxidoreductase
MALRYIVENDLNRIIVDAPRPWLGIVAGGHACEQVMESLATLGLDEAGLAEVGVRVLKLGALAPFDGQSVRRLAYHRKPWLRLDQQAKASAHQLLVVGALYGAVTSPGLGSGTPRASRWSRSPARSPPRAWSGRCAAC